MVIYSATRRNASFARRSTISPHATKRPSRHPARHTIRLRAIRPATVLSTNHSTNRSTKNLHILSNSGIRSVDIYSAYTRRNASYARRSIGSHRTLDRGSRPTRTRRSALPDLLLSRRRHHSLPTDPQHHQRPDLRHLLPRNRRPANESRRSTRGNIAADRESCCSGTHEICSLLCAGFGGLETAAV